MDTTKTITHLSLCSGYSGIGLGLKQLLPGLREIAHLEIEAFAVCNLVAKMEEGRLPEAPIYTDVKTFPYGRFRGCVDILSGGFPCQPFSAAGLRQGVEDPRHLYPYISRGIRECKPRIVFLENVEGIISSKTADGESVLKYVLSDLEGMGYRATAGIFSAEEVGAPHRRKRVFILGYSELVNTDSNGHGKHTATSKAKPIGGTEATIMSRSDELSDTDSQGLEGLRKCDTPEGWEESDGQPRCSCKVWPSRPNQPQYEWEEPRTKPKLGGTTDGASSRVDRLRLLGNGVVPDTAAKAFATLIGRMYV